MAEDESYIDIMKQVVVPIEDIDIIINNPEGLTLEGIKFNIAQYPAGAGGKKGVNRYIRAKYELMLKSCKNITKSGKLSNGKTILSRDEDGSVTWSEMIDENFQLTNQKPIEVKVWQ